MEVRVSCSAGAVSECRAHKARPIDGVDAFGAPPGPAGLAFQERECAVDCDVMRGADVACDVVVAETEEQRD